jgi:hypothetical protein
MITMKRSDFRIFGIILPAILLSTVLASGQNISRTFSWKYNLNKDAKVTMENYDCNLKIHTQDKGETEFKLTIEAEAKSAEDAAILEKYLQEMVFNSSPSSATFKSTFWESRNTIMNRTTLKLSGGKSITLKSFSIRGELWIPAACNFSLDSKYSTVTMEDFAGQLDLGLYNNNFSGGKVTANVELNDKYSTIGFRDMKDLHASLYNSKLNAANIGDLIIESKYSEVTLISCGKLSVDSYNDKYEAPRTGDVTFKAKYSELTTESSGNVSLDVYNGRVKMREVKDAKITSKYAEYNFAVAGRCSIPNSYNDKFSFDNLNALSVDVSKYSTFDIGNLKTSVEDKDSYNDAFSISESGKEFSQFSVNGKYTTASLAVPKSLSYRFKADVSYADFSLDESSLKSIEKINDGIHTKYNAIKGAESDGMPVIDIKGYQINLTIEDK